MQHTFFVHFFVAALWNVEFNSDEFKANLPMYLPFYDTATYKTFALHKQKKIDFYFILREFSRRNVFILYQQEGNLYAHASIWSVEVPQRRFLRIGPLHDSDHVINFR